MKLQYFLKLVEIKTKVASVIPFIIGLLYAAYHYNRINVMNSIIFFISMILFDMTVTALNNYFDFKKAKKRSGYNFELHNAMARYNLNPTLVLTLIIIMLLTAAITGIILSILTGVVVLTAGILCFIVGILYSFGPIPISRTPAGEVFSGFIMGFIILFLAVYVNVSDLQLITYSIDANIFTLKMDYYELSRIFILSIPCVFGIAGIMLANNICDIENDLADGRYTLPIYIGKKKALYIFAALYAAVFTDIIIIVFLKILPIFFLIILLTAIPVVRNIIKFFGEQSKKTTFALSVQNFLSISAGIIVIMFLLVIININNGNINIDFSAAKL